jgi:spore cortex formation protein SpoVR/YcgB (stage V sporulation)
MNPYELGFAMMRDIQRIATEPTAEDRDWFPGFAGSGDWKAALLDAWANHRDESFILQYLSPSLIRQMHLFVLADDATESEYKVSAIHDERGYEKVRSALARNLDVGANQPDIQVVDADLMGDRELRLQHTVHEGVLLSEEGRDATLRHVRRLWGYDVSLVGIDARTSDVLYEVSAEET